MSSSKQPLSNEDYDFLAQTMLAERGDARSLTLLGKQQLVEKEQVTELKALISRAANQQLFFEELKKTQNQVIPFAPVKIKNPRKDLEHVLHLSDWQLGQCVTAASTGGLSEYSTEIATERLENLVGQIIAEQLLNPATALRILAGGDMAEGENIFPGQTWALDRNAAEQTITGGKLLAQLVRALAPYYKTISFTGVLGNHGRFSKESSVSSNLDILMMKMAEYQLGSVKNLTFNVETETWFRIVRFFDSWNALLVHGDDLSLSIKGLRDKVGAWKGMSKQDFAVAFTAHHHVPIKLVCSDATVYGNGSLVGSSPYSTKKMTLGNAASQNFFIISKRGVEWNKELILDTKPRQARVHTA